MPTVADLLALLMNPPEEGTPETIYDDINKQYETETAEHASAIENANTAIAQRDATIAELKSQNYDLLMAVNGKNDDNNEPENVDTEIDGIDALFELE